MHSGRKTWLVALYVFNESNFVKCLKAKEMNPHTHRNAFAQNSQSTICSPASQGFSALPPSHQITNLGNKTPTYLSSTPASLASSHVSTISAGPPLHIPS